MEQNLLHVDHAPGVAIEVKLFDIEAPEHVAGFDIFVIRDGLPQVIRLYDPAAVTNWFEHNSQAHTAQWQAAYHSSGIDPAILHKPSIPLVQPYTVAAGQDELWKIAQEVLGDGNRWPEIWALNPGLMGRELKVGETIQLPQYKPEDMAEGDILLKVPYYNQRDNDFHPSGTCNVTSFAMALDYYGVTHRHPDERFPDELGEFMLHEGKDRHDHAQLDWLAAQYGLTSHFDTNRTWDEIREQLRAGHPVIVSGQYTSAGHIIIIIGLRGDDFIVHDPWGDALTGYSSHNGQQRLYPYSYMNAKTKDLGDNGKWAHFISRAD